MALSNAARLAEVGFEVCETPEKWFVLDHNNCGDVRLPCVAGGPAPTAKQYHVGHGLPRVIRRHARMCSGVELGCNGPLRLLSNPVPDAEPVKKQARSVWPARWGKALLNQHQDACRITKHTIPGCRHNRGREQPSRIATQPQMMSASCNGSMLALHLPPLHCLLINVHPFRAWLGHAGMLQLLRVGQVSDGSCVSVYEGFKCTLAEALVTNQLVTDQLLSDTDTTQRGSQVILGCCKQPILLGSRA